MIIVQVKRKNKILADDEQILALGETVAQFKARFIEVDNAFFSNMYVKVIVQTNHTWAQYYAHLAGQVHYRQHVCHVWTLGRKQIALPAFQTAMHELGHYYHYYNESNDFHKRTDYGKELYAEQFAAMVMQDDYSIEEQTDWKAYDGYTSRKIYKDTPKPFIKPYK